MDNWNTFIQLTYPPPINDYLHPQKGKYSMSKIQNNMKIRKGPLIKAYSFICHFKQYFYSAPNLKGNLHLTS